MIVGDSVVTRNGEEGVIEKFTYPYGPDEPVAWVRNEWGVFTTTANYLKPAPLRDAYGIEITE